MSCSNDDGTPTTTTTTTTTIPTTTKSCHYQILGISSNASHEEVKAAHRSLALRLHPDKRQSHTDSLSLQKEEFSFRQVQLAWECLRDPLKRKEYDEDVQRQQTQWKSRTQGATRLYLSEMQECIEDEDEEVEEHEDEHALSTTTSNNNTNTGYVHECRCGEYVELWKEDMPTTMVLSKEILIDCPGCCLSYCIILDK